jgi:hypothetical protein
MTLKQKRKTGPIPETLKISGDWRAAVAHALTVKPEPVTAKKKKKRKGVR